MQFLDSISNTAFLSLWCTIKDWSQYLFGSWRNNLIEVYFETRHVVILSLSWNRLMLENTRRHQTDGYLYYQLLSTIKYDNKKKNVRSVTYNFTQTKCQNGTFNIIKWIAYNWEGDGDIVTPWNTLLTSASPQLTMISRCYSILSHPLKYMLFI